MSDSTNAKSQGKQKHKYIQPAERSKKSKETVASSNIYRTVQGRTKQPIIKIYVVIISALEQFIFKFAIVFNLNVHFVKRLK